MVSQFWAYMREDTDSFNLEKKSGKVNFSFPKDKYRLQKVNIVCLKILDVFFEKNLQYINQELLFASMTDQMTVAEDRYNLTLKKFLDKVD